MMDCIYRKVVLNVGLPFPSMIVRYDLQELYKATIHLSDADYKDYIEVICHLMQEFSEDDFDIDYLTFNDNVSTILRKNGVGYRILDSKLIKIIDEKEFDLIIKPAFIILKTNEFDEAYNQAIVAFEHYGRGDNTSCLVEMNKSFETTIRIIYQKMGLSYNKDAKMQIKISTLMDNGLIPHYLQSYFNTFSSILSSFAVIRNQIAAHSKKESTVISDTLTQYMIDQAMSGILFLVRSWADFSHSH